MKNILIRKKRYFCDGGNDGIIRLQPQLQIPTNQFSNVNMQHVEGVPKKNMFGSTSTNDIMGKVGGYAQVAEAGIGGAINGANNWNKGQVETEKNTFKSAENDANNVAQQYSAGQTQMNILSKTGPASSANDLKTHKGWKNILGSTGKGAMAGASVGGIWGAAIGGAIGLIGSSIGEIIGGRKRKKEAEKLAQMKKESDFAIDYHNSKQAEQLASANEQAAKAQADENKRSVLAIAAYGGRLKRNYLLNNIRIV